MFVKPKREINKVFLHHSATDRLAHDNVDFIRKIHIGENKWSDIGYHYFITKNGTLHLCRPLKRVPAAQKGHNKGTIAVCLSGSKHFTSEQKDTLTTLCETINNAYAGNIMFHGHKEVKNTKCPAYDYKVWLNLDENGKMVPKVFTSKEKPSLWDRIKKWWANLGE